jgi:hypothetical protein
MYADYFIHCDTMLFPDFISALSQDPGSFMADLREKFNEGKVLYIHEDALSEASNGPTQGSPRIPPLLTEWLKPESHFVLNNRKYIKFIPIGPQ